MSVRRVFVIVMDSFGIGALPDAGRFGDAGSDTLRAVAAQSGFCAPTLASLGLFNIAGTDHARAVRAPRGAFGRMAERSAAKDTTTGHWELAGLISESAPPTFPGGFPQDFIDRLEQATGRGTLCNRPYSGTQLLLDYGREHEATGKLIVYTSADSVFQIAAHEAVVPLPELYAACETARGLLTGPLAVSRVIARPFVGEYPRYTRTANRHDYSLPPTGPTMLDRLTGAGYDVIGVGKIGDIFAGVGVGESLRTTGNADGMARTLDCQRRDFTGLCFVNLVDFDMLYGHRNDAAGYAAAVMEFDRWLPAFLGGMRGGDLLFVTADHGCDPSTPSTDHSREYVPLLAAGPTVRAGADIGTRASFADLAETVLDAFGLDGLGTGTSFLHDIVSK
ncbi:phosphopentomutase [Feifania hominis]|uniref:Phosphopentomutase n=1 Tax=Feifania hominis TaxID=2763660 RepID=A0A926DCB1_9FIRM|nr:phosphopentomutase [Feifania hominis]MBC8536350.1 phosphopentomutase [Feifania hominis]